MLIYLLSSTCFIIVDVIKTKMQTNPEKYNKGMLHAARDIVTTDGLGVLLAGLGELHHGITLQNEEFAKLYTPSIKQVLQ